MRGQWNPVRLSALLGAVSLAALWSANALAGAIIDNGTVQLGVNDDGSLIVDADGTTNDGIGLTYLPTHGEALAPGCFCEGWGMIDFTNPTNAFGVSRDNDTINAGNGTSTFTVTGTGTDALSTGSSAVSVVNITMGGTAWARVTQDFHPSASPFLYEDTVTILNTGTTSIGDLGFRRVMDWDVPPTEFEEVVTIKGWGNAALIHSSDDGFHSSDMNDSLVGSGLQPGTEDQDFTNSGPDDHGAAFDFDFGTLPRGAQKQFNIYYGAAGNPTDALAALTTVGAEVYSLGMPSNFATDDPNFGTPNTFIFAFKGLTSPIVGGVPVSVSTLGEIRQMSQMMARYNNADMRMDALSGGGEREQGGGDGLGWHVYASGGYDDGDLRPIHNSRQDFNFWGGQVGADYTWAGDSAWAQNFRAGMALSYNSGDASGPVGTSHQQREGIDTSDNITVTGYAGMRWEDFGYADVQASLGFLDYDTHRLFVVDHYHGSTTDTQFDIKLRVGRDYTFRETEHHKMTIGPYGSIEYTDGTIDAFHEHSSTDPDGALLFRSVDYSGWTSQVGLRFNCVHVTGDSHVYGVMLKAAWEHDFLDNVAEQIVDSVNSLPSAAPYSQREIDKMRFGARVYLTSPDNAFTVAIEDELSTGQQHDNAITARLRLRL